MRRRGQPRPRPPKRRCRDCGGDVWTWRVDPLCSSCVELLSAEPEGESIRQHLRRTGRLTTPPADAPAPAREGDSGQTELPEGF